ncbi:17880_t:CDS:2 [Entrophospora sp. SA101]|nr:9605_t:CDS:2 [Entrophospora sp. SA101]CAJ0853951.1 17880_t:CDS:2 [Entrophospora sp. SA101]
MKDVALKELLQGAKFSHEFPEVIVFLPISIEVVHLLNQYPKNNKDDEEDEFKDDYPKNEYMEIDIQSQTKDVDSGLDEFLDIYKFKHKVGPQNTNKVYVNAAESKSGMITAINSLKLNSAILKTEYKRYDFDLIVLLTHFQLNNKSLYLKRFDTIKSCKNIALVDGYNFKEFYGYTYADREEFIASNKTINVNTATPEILKTLGIKPEQGRKLHK